MTLHKVLKYLAIVIGVIGLILLGRIVFTGDEAITDSADLQTSMLNPMMYLAYIVFAIIVVLVLVFVIKGLFRGNIKNTLISLGAFALVIIIAYLLSDGSVPPGINLEDERVASLDESDFHWIGTGLVSFYILAAIAIGAMIFSGIKKLAK